MQSPKAEIVDDFGPSRSVNVRSANTLGGRQAMR